MTDSTHVENDVRIAIIKSAFLVLRPCYNLEVFNSPNLYSNLLSRVVPGRFSVTDFYAEFLVRLMDSRLLAISYLAEEGGVK